jgi:hypothetical protein
MVELLVAMATLVLLGTMLMAMMSSALSMWNAAERQRKVYARARTVFSYLDQDLEAALTRNAPGAPLRNRLFCEKGRDGRQVLMLVRTFGYGTERGYAFGAGDGLDIVNRPWRAEKPAADDEDPDPRTGRADEEAYDFADNDGDGRLDEDLAPLGGSAQVSYLHQGRELRRALRSPAGDEFASTFARSQLLAEDVLHFGLLFATPYTTSRFDAGGATTVTWDESVPRLPDTKYRGARGFGPDRLWDSTRGVLPEFSFYVGPESKDDPADDVFPEVVRVVVVVEPHELRTVRTEVTDDVGDADGLIEVASTRGFPEPGGPTSYILVDDEWMYYTRRDERSFTVKRRGARGTVAGSHIRGAQVRCGTTFTRTFYLPGYRSEDAAVIREGE